jgi:hypothetical protein
MESVVYDEDGQIMTDALSEFVITHIDMPATPLRCVSGRRSRRRGVAEPGMARGRFPRYIQTGITLGGSR